MKRSIRIMDQQSLVDLFNIASLWRHPSFSTVVVVLAVVAGLLGSLYSDEIKAAFPFYLGAYTGIIAWKAVVFWSCVIIFGFLFFLGKRATDRANEKTRQELVSETQKLGQLIRTLPPAEFLYFFEDIFVECHHAVTQIFDRSGVSPGDIEHAIRVVLDGVVSVAKDFAGGRPRNVVYAANLMLFRPKGSFNETSATNLKKRLKFVEPGVDIYALLGVLDLQTNLSTTTQTKEQDPDTNLTPLALPIPVTPKGNQMKWRVLPGAPMAFHTGDMEAYTDTRTLGDWCRKQGDFSPSVCAEVEEYFNTGANPWMGSFLSLSLIKGIGEDYPPGVLNLHQDSPGLLKDREPAKHFVPLMHPFLSLIVQLLRFLDRQKTMVISARNS